LLSASRRQLRFAETETRKVPVWFHLKDKQPFAFAGLWDMWRDIDGEVLQTYDNYDNTECFNAAYSQPYACHLSRATG